MLSHIIETIATRLTPTTVAGDLASGRNLAGVRRHARDIGVMRVAIVSMMWLSMVP